MVKIIKWAMGVIVLLGGFSYGLCKLMTVKSGTIQLNETEIDDLIK